MKQIQPPITGEILGGLKCAFFIVFKRVSYLKQSDFALKV